MKNSIAYADRIGKYPFRFIAVSKRAEKDGGGWAMEEF